MPIYEFEGKKPRISPGAYVHPTAVVIGNVTIADRCWIGPNASLRGDEGRIVVGYGTAVQDNCVLHGDNCILGAYSNLGHGAVVHGAQIGEHVLIANRAVVLDNAVVEDWGVVAAGAVVAPQAVVPSGKMVMGVPAAVVSETPASRRDRFGSEDPDVGYRGMTSRYRNALREVTLEEVLTQE